MAGGKLWTEDEDAYIAELVGRGMSNADMVAEFRAKFGHDRSANALRKRRADISSDDGRVLNGKPPTPDDLQDYQLLGGQFLFVINERFLAIEFDRWDQICRDYSEHGSNLTTAEVARKYGVPMPILRRCLTKYGQYKASPPNCRERIGEHKADLSPLIAEAIENDEHRFIQQLEGKREREWRADYLKLKSETLVQDRIIQAAERIAGQMPPVKIGNMSRKALSGDTWTSHVPTTDEHAGKLVWAKESFGDDLDTYITAERLRGHADSAAAWIMGQPGRCETVYRTFLGDLFHALMGETDHGTKLDQDTRAGKVWAETAEACVYSVATLAGVADRVVVKGSKGNHDGFLFYVFLEYLKARLAHIPNVSVEPTPHPYDYFRVGTALHVLDHGYRVGSLSGWKAKAQAETVAREIGGADYHGAEMIYTYVGHLHEDEKGSHGAHLQLRRLPSLGEADDYETSLRYASRPTAHLFRLNAAGLIQAEHILYRSDMHRLTSDALRAS